jgi:hypothetical protein
LALLHDAGLLKWLKNLRRNETSVQDKAAAPKLRSRRPASGRKKARFLSMIHKSGRRFSGKIMLPTKT